MRCKCLLALVLCCMLCAPVTGSAQFFYGLSDSGFSSALRVGYLDHHKGFRVGYDLEYTDKTRSRVIEAPQRGVAVELSLGYNFTDRLRWTATGGILLPLGTIKTQMRHLEPWGNPPDPNLYARGMDFESWFLDSLWLYDLGAGFQAAMGSRLDHTNSQFLSEYIPDNPLFVYSPGRVNTKCNVYVPYVGIQYELGSSENRLTTRFIGLPYIFGRLEDEDIVAWYDGGLPAEIGTAGQVFKSSFESGYFAEVSCEYTLNMLSDVGTAIFCKYTIIHGKTEYAVQDWAGFIPPALTFALENPGYAVFHKESWTFGGAVSMAFQLPWL